MLKTPFLKAIGRFFLKKEAGRKQRVSSHVEVALANSIGIIYAFTNEPELECVRKYSESLREEGFKEVKLLIFFPSRKKRDLFTRQKSEIFYSPQDANWMGLPGSKEIKAFTGSKFDVLIDLTEDEILLDFLISKSEAVWKIGKSVNGRTFLHDMLINTKSGTPLKTLIEQVDFYMRMMGSTEPATLHPHETTQR